MKDTFDIHDMMAPNVRYAVDANGCGWIRYGRRAEERDLHAEGCIPAEEIALDRDFRE